MIKFLETIRDFVNSFINVLTALLKIVLLSKFNVKLPKLKKGDMAFLANGPSLNEALIKMKKKGIPSNLMVTNFFCNSIYFKQLKPNHYTICDPLFNYEGYQKDERIVKFYETIFDVDWELALFVPSTFQKGIKKIIKQGNYKNKNVSIYFYNSTNFNGNNNVLLALVRLKLGMPRPTTVAIPALFNCMFIGYKKIKIAGIDLNQHLDIRVNKENVLELQSKHFYNNETVIAYKPWFNKDGLNYKTSEIFLVFYNFFYSFDVAASYAKKYNIEIVNYSEESYLNQFKKV